MGGSFCAAGREIHRHGKGFLVQTLVAVSAAAGRAVVGWQQVAPIVLGLPFRIQMVGP